MSRAFDVLPEKTLGDLNLDPCAVTGLAIGVDRAAMPHRLQGGDARFHHPAAGSAIDGGHKSDTTGIMLEGGIVEPVPFEAGSFGGPAGVAHGPHSS